MADIVIWNEEPGPVPGNTPFGFFDNDAQFIADAPKVAIWTGRRLGFPIVDIEMQDINFYACFEEACNEFSAQVNRFSIQNNYHNLIGKNKTVNFTEEVITPDINNIIRISDKYGQESMTGLQVPIQTGSIDIVPGQQVYDLLQFVPNGKEIEIKTVYHAEPVTSTQYYYGLYGDAQRLSNEFGWNAHHAGATFMMYPLYADLLMIQEVEMMRHIRKSAYGFDLYNNQIRIFPKPQYAMTVWFDYVFKDFRDEIPPTNPDSDKVTNAANMGFEQVAYADINAPGKQWIKEYTYALAKELLGLIRSKYQSIPGPDNDVTLDGEVLRNEAISMKEQLIEGLQKMFEEMTLNAHYERQRLESETTQEVLSRVPLGIYIG